MRIRAPAGTFQASMRSLIWITVRVYALVALVKKRFNLTRGLYGILQNLRLSLFEKTRQDAALMLAVGPYERPSDGTRLIQVSTNVEPGLRSSNDLPLAFMHDVV